MPQDYEQQNDSQQDHPFENVSLDYYNQSATAVSWQEEDVDESDVTTTFETNEQFYGATWANGYNSILNPANNLEPVDPEQFLSGFAIPAVVGIDKETRMPENLKRVMDKLVKEKKAVSFPVKHDNGAIKTYYQLVDGTYVMYPMLIGLPKVQKFTSEIIPNDCYRENGPMPDPNNLLGVVVGRETNINKKISKQTTNNFCVFLVVISSLWDAGYVDADGLPIPIRLKFTGFAKDEAIEMLQKHVGFVKRAQEFDPQRLPASEAEPYMFGLYMHNDEKRIRRENSKKEGNYAFKVTAQMPEQFDMAFMRKMYLADKVKRTALKRLMREQYIKDDGKRGTRPGGIVVKWCRQYAVYNIVYNQRKFNPVTKMHPSGECQYGKNKDLTPRISHLINQTAQQTAQTYGEGERPNRTFKGTAQASPAQTSYEEYETQESETEEGPNYWDKITDLIARAEMSSNPQAKVHLKALNMLFEGMQNDTASIEEVEEGIKAAERGLAPRKSFSRRP